MEQTFFKSDSTWKKHRWLKKASEKVIYKKFSTCQNVLLRVETHKMLFFVPYIVSKLLELLIYMASFSFDTNRIEI